jgi:hypothetical protein
MGSTAAVLLYLRTALATAFPPPGSVLLLIAGGSFYRAIFLQETLTLPAPSFPVKGF